MIAQPIAIQNTGLVTSVGLSAQASCAAFRAKITNPTETRFIDSGGEWIMANQVQLEQPSRGLTKLTKMAAMAIVEALHDVPKKEWSRLPLLLCVAEMDRPGRMAGLDDQLFPLIQAELGVTFAQKSGTVAQGRVGVAVALAQARALMAKEKIPRVLIAATDSLLSWPTLSHYGRQDRLLTAKNSNGFVPGEGAGAVLLGSDEGRPGLVCTGIGFGVEAAHIDSEQPLRADGLTAAIRQAIVEAGLQMHELDLRIADLSGEQYGFKEASLAISRLLRVRKEEFDLWHPAECTGEPGAVAGLSCLSIGHAAAYTRFAPGRFGILHFGNDGGRRACVAFRLNMP